MPNFPPLRRYIFSVVDRWIVRHRLKSPFLEIGCGTGDLAEHLARRGWTGTAIDSSAMAAAEARRRLSGFPDVSVIEGGLEAVGNDRFDSAFMMDVLEHVREDEALLAAIAGALRPGGALIALTPVNPGEWRQDDVRYGHYRRYAWDELERKFRTAGFRLVDRWNVTVPFMWLLRRMYVRLLPSEGPAYGRDALTAASSMYNPWHEVRWLRLAGALGGLPWWWRPAFVLQDLFSGSRRGHAAMFLAVRDP